MRLTPQFKRWLDEFEAICWRNDIDEWDTDMLMHKRMNTLQNFHIDNKTPQEAYDYINPKVV